MIIKSEFVLTLFRRGPCEYCGKTGPTDAAHRLTKLMGGGGRIDHPWNVCALCFKCHRVDHHGGREPRARTMLELISKRESIHAQDIEKEMYYIREAPRGTVYDWSRIQAGRGVQTRIMLADPRFLVHRREVEAKPVSCDYRLATAEDEPTTRDIRRSANRTRRYLRM